jgi:glyoxylase-like metal-dependent hydrolase (beta-lactamase superfamily II)
LPQSVIPVTVPTPYPVGPVNLYLYRKENRLLLIDAGVNTDEAWNLFRASLTEAGTDVSQLDAVVLTHHHADHIGLVNRLTKERDLPVYIHPNGMDRVTRDREFLEKRATFFSELYDEMGCGTEGRDYMARTRHRLEESGEAWKLHAPLTAIREGERIPGWEELDIIESFGHAPDHIVLFEGESQTLFAGDHLLSHISSNAIVEPDGRMQRMKTLVQYRDSLIRMREIPAATVYPGHGPVIGDHAELIALRLERMNHKAERIRNIMAGRELTAFEIAREMYAQEYQSQFFLVMSEIIGHLDLLADEGKIQKIKKEGIWRFMA